MDIEYEHDSTRIMSVGWVNALSVYTSYRQLQRFHITFLTYMGYMMNIIMDVTHFHLRLEAMRTPMGTLLSGAVSSELAELHSFVSMCLNLVLYFPKFLWIEITHDMISSLLLYVCILHVVSSIHINTSMLSIEKKLTGEKKVQIPIRRYQIRPYCRELQFLPCYMF